MRKLALKSIYATFSTVTLLFYWFLKSWCQVILENAIYSKFYLIIFECHEICTDLHITDIAIWCTLRRFEGCLEVEEWLKTGNKHHSSQAWLSLKLLPTFLAVLLIRDKAECNLIKVVTMRKLLILAAKMAQLWLSIVQHLVLWPTFFISLLQSACLREHWYKIWEKSIWFFYHARATLTSRWTTVLTSSVLTLYGHTDCHTKWRLFIFLLLLLLLL